MFLNLPSKGYRDQDLQFCISILDVFTLQKIRRQALFSEYYFISVVRSLLLSLTYFVYGSLTFNNYEYRRSYISLT